MLQSRFSPPGHNHDPPDEIVEIVCALRAVGRGCPWSPSKVASCWWFQPSKICESRWKIIIIPFTQSVMISLDIKSLGAVTKDSELGSSSHENIPKRKNYSIFAPDFSLNMISELQFPKLETSHLPTPHTTKSG